MTTPTQPPGSSVPQLPTRQIKWYGWKPSIPDFRDFQIAPPTGAVSLPPRVDLRDTGFLPDVWSQGPFGSCTAHALAAAFAFENAKQKGTPYTPSRFFIYRGEREIEGTIAEDGGAQLRDGLKVLSTLGAPHEALWPYVPENFSRTPSADVYADGLLHVATAYHAVPNDEAAPTLGVLASGTPVAFGFAVVSSFESDVVARTGIAPMPTPADSVLGGHAVLAVGYDMSTRMLLVRNSWGPQWSSAMRGYFWFPFDYAFGGLASDFWTVTVCST